MENKVRLIDANALGIYKFETNDAFRGFVTVIPFDLITTAPTIAAVPVVHGMWENNYPNSICSVCKYINRADITMWSRWDSPYCPSCGAKMDLKEKLNDDHT